MLLRRFLLIPATVVIGFGVFAASAGAATATITSTICPRGCTPVKTLNWATGDTATPHTFDMSHPFALVGTDHYSFIANNENTTLGAGTSGVCTHNTTGNGFTCNPTGFDRVNVTLGEQGDTLRVNPSCGIRCRLSPFDKRIIVAGNGGDDTLAGGALADSLDGGNGGDTLSGGAGADALTAGSGPDTLVGGQDNDGTLDGGDGVDTVSYDDGRATGVTVTMNGGAADGDGENVIAEKLVGSQQPDVLTGGTAGDEIEARGGDDRVAGGAGSDILGGETGNDTLDGGADNDNLSGGAGSSDTVTYASRTAAVDVTLGGVSGNGEGTESDFINADVENATGGAGGDTLSVTGALIPGGSTLAGAAGTDAITGGSRNDTLIGGAGADTLEGGGGTDLVSYADHSAGVNATLGGLLATAPEDQITGAEALLGGGGSDKLIGDGGPNAITGGAGDDRIQGGAAADTLRGGAGRDTLDYSERASGQPVDVSLDSLVNDGATSELDDIGSDFEIVQGGAGADKLSAAAVPGAALRGNSGNDVLFAPNGGGTLDGGAGNDQLTGGDGADVIGGGLGDDAIDGQGDKDSVSGGEGDDTIEARDGAADTIDCGADEDTALSDSIDTRKDCERGSIRTPPVVVVVSDPQPQPQPQPVVTPRIFATVTFNFAAFAAFTKFTSFKVKNVPAGATVRVSCKGPKGKKCVAKPFKKKRSGTISVKPYTKKKFPAGTKITVAITKTGAIGLVKVISVVRRKAPTSKTLCLPPGAKKPSKCTA